METLVATVLQVVLTPVALAGVLAWTAQGFFSQMSARDLAHYNHQLERELERDKKVLEAAQFEQQTKFSWAHEKLTEVIGTIYGKLAEAHNNMSAMMHPAQFGTVDREALRNRAIDAYDVVFEYFTINRVYVSEINADKVSKLIGLMRLSFNQFQLSQGAPGGATAAQMEAWKKVDEEASPVLAELRKEFRSALGIAE